MGLARVFRFPVGWLFEIISRALGHRGCPKLAGVWLLVN